MQTSILLALTLCCELIRQCSPWVPTAEPRMHLSYNPEQLDRFTGNSNHTDFFNVLFVDHASIIVGSRNTVHNLSLPTLVENRDRRIDWPPSEPHKEMCILKFISEEGCQNYIRIGSMINENTMLLCGTNAYKPHCQEYNLQDERFVRGFDGKGICAYDPRHNSSYIYTDGHLYSATVADYSAVDPLIYRDPLRTEKSNLKQLNEPNFVNTISYEDYVLFFFRESAVEFINCGKVIYSRVARICKRDKGGPHLFSDRWTSFIKARLNCSISGDYPFYFNEIQSTSDIVSGSYGKNHLNVIYGVFTTPPNSIRGSAICIFNVSDIMNTFDSSFKDQKDINSNWLRIENSKVPDPRPGKCVNDSRTLPASSVNFAKSHSLMDESVPSFMPPLLVKVSLRQRYTAIAVDPQVKTITGEPMDVLFIGTDDGHVLKGIYKIGGNPSDVFIEDIHVVDSNSPIKSLSIVRLPYKTPKLLIVTDDSIQTIPLYRCSRISSCRECVAIQDPYCAWDNQGNVCIAHEENTLIKKNLLQNVAQGSHQACQTAGVIEQDVVNRPLIMKSAPNDVEGTNMRNCPKCSMCTNNPCVTADHPVVGTQEKIVIYTADTLGIVVATSVLATLVVGFVAGYFCSKHFRHDSPYSNMPLHSHHQLNRLNETNVHGESASYLTSCANNKAAINLVVNVPPKTSNDKNANASPENNKTLQKIKKTYI